MQNRDDIFDRLMSLRFLSFAKPFYLAHKEVLLYVLFGGLTTVISILSFTLAYEFCVINEHIANIMSWILAVTFAFITNRTWVFKGSADNNATVFKQALSFYAGRVFTLLVEEVVVFVFITWLGFSALLVKVATQAIVLILNYVISKYYVFNKSL